MGEIERTFGSDVKDQVGTLYLLWPGIYVLQTVVLLPTRDIQHSCLSVIWVFSTNVYRVNINCVCRAFNSRWMIIAFVTYDQELMNVFIKDWNSWHWSFIVLSRTILIAGLLRTNETALFVAHLVTSGLFDIIDYNIVNIHDHINEEPSTVLSFYMYWITVSAKFFRIFIQKNPNLPCPDLPGPSINWEWFLSPERPGNMGFDCHL